MTFELKTFQAKASRQIADRYLAYATDENRPAMGKRPMPFFQALSSMTGSGKTAMLAQAVAEMRAMLPNSGVEPVVLWMSKAVSVVEQTKINFLAGGRYSSLIDGFRVLSAKDLDGKALEDGSVPLMLVLTTGVFNNKDAEGGNLNFHQPNEDRFGGESPWAVLGSRKAGQERRHLFVVYDESHNLSEQQTDLLEGIQPDAYLMASATLRFPDSFVEDVIRPYERWAAKAYPGVVMPEFTVVDSRVVVENALVKRHIHFDGTTSSMERCVDELLAQMEVLDSQAQPHGITPKAIYVCDTNMVADEGADDPGLAFEMRRSPMIRIWRHLVARGVDPLTIAIHSSELKVDASSKPAGFNLFGKAGDFQDFHAGDFRHIIFNKSLQEGWDDPECYLGYIDRSIGSRLRVEQIIGRVLRQPLQRHFDNPLLNMAQFFIRVDKKETFSSVVDAVKEKLATGLPSDFLNSSFSGDGLERNVEERPRLTPALGMVNIELGLAVQGIAKLFPPLCTFSDGDSVSLGKSEKMKKVVDITTAELVDKTCWTTVEAVTRKVSLRWLISLRIRELSHRVLNVTDTTDAMFDRKVHFGSLMDGMVSKAAKDAVAIYSRFASLDYNSDSEMSFPVSSVRPSTAVSFNHSVYERYSGMNGFERGFAKALDGFSARALENGEGEIVWHRNPSTDGGYRIPLVDDGETANFFPDFLVWRNGVVFCLDTKGGHLLGEAVRRKLFDIKEGDTTRLKTRFVSKGKQSSVDEKPSGDGYTVWLFKNNVEFPVQCDGFDDAVEAALQG
jgi:hypothetical protein